MVVSPATTPWRPGEYVRSSTVVIVPSLVVRPDARRLGLDDDGHARGLHPLDGTRAVTHLEIDGADGLLDDGRLEAERPRVERRLDHAVVGREPDDHEPACAGAAKDALQPG